MTDPQTHAKQLIDNAGRVVVLTGAGISTDSAIPDFRGPSGVWTKNPEAEKLSTIQHYMASGDVRRRAWKARRAMRMWDKEPNAGHRALLALERAGKLHTLITQNVDGLHQKAGTDPARVVEIHGTVLHTVCMDCGQRLPMAETLKRLEAGEEDPPCLACGGILKSATISFGQSLVAEDLERAERAAQGCDLLIAIGSTLSVFPIAGVVPVAKRAGAQLLIINGEPTEMDAIADVVIHGSISEVLSDLLGG